MDQRHLCEQVYWVASGRVLYNRWTATRSLRGSLEKVFTFHWTSKWYLIRCIIQQRLNKLFSSQRDMFNQLLSFWRKDAQEVEKRKQFSIDCICSYQISVGYICDIPNNGEITKAVRTIYLPTEILRLICLFLIVIDLRMKVIWVI